MSEWETHYLPDIECFVRVRPHEGRDFIVDVEAFEGVGWQVPGEEWPEDVPDKFHRRVGSFNDRVGPHALDDAYRTLHGTVKWDGCADLTWGEPGDAGYAHYCGMTHAIRVGTLMEHAYRIAWEFHLKDREHAYDGDWALYSGDYTEEERWRGAERAAGRETR